MNQQEPQWKLIRNRITGECDVVWREWPNGRQESMLVTTKQYQDWLAEGNTPLPADEDNTSE
jgi:hypothetical protein